VRLDAPEGWRVSPELQRFTLGNQNSAQMVEFTVTAPQRADRTRITAVARVNAVDYSNQRVEINYDHIPPQLLQPAARLKASSFEVATRGRRVGYIPGAGDLTVQSLRELGYSVDSLRATDMNAARLREYDAIVVGIRAYNVNEIFPAANAALFAYAENGGTVVVQYHPTADLRSTTVAPYPVSISSDRVTNENATVTFLAPDHPVLNTPNKISAADFEGWVQELGLYFPNQWDSRFTPILAANDEGEAPMRGSLLVARHGQGWYVYTGLSFFRQLPAGVPGAYRLFANLVSLGR
jgi:hypothetical protein